MTSNVNPETGIRYGIISSQSLHPDVVQTLQEGTDVYYEDAKAAVLKAAERAQEPGDSPYWNPDEDGKFDPASEGDKQLVLDRWHEDTQDNPGPDEPVHEGVHDGVKYRTTWLGGALLVWVFESPHKTKARLCSPCVPNCGDLDSLDPENGEECYDVPPEWRDTE